MFRKHLVSGGFFCNKVFWLVLVQWKKTQYFLWQDDGACFIKVAKPWSRLVELKKINKLYPFILNRSMWVHRDVPQNLYHNGKWTEILPVEASRCHTRHKMSSRKYSPENLWGFEFFLHQCTCKETQLCQKACPVSQKLVLADIVIHGNQWSSSIWPGRKW